MTMNIYLKSGWIIEGIPPEVLKEIIRVIVDKKGKGNPHFIYSDEMFVSLQEISAIFPASIKGKFIQ